jgi:hypothetical protein
MGFQWVQVVFDGFSLIPDDFRWIFNGLGDFRWIFNDVRWVSMGFH